MERDNELRRFLAWTGVLALLSVPILMLLRRKRNGDRFYSYAEEGNVFESELEG
ncbi:MAG TPA: hypothetical protein VJO14_03410 [Bacteroidota bacterium]|nr:hypothetical protein [Bacteroidota bacterium]